MQAALRHALEGFQGALRENVALGPLTHVRIGGSADLLAEPFTETAVAQLVKVCGEFDLPLRVLGGGSNVLISDDGVRGVVVRLDQLNKVVRDGDRLTAGAGTSLPTLLRGAREQGLAGLEKLTGIPAQVGGAVRMNAGTRDGETFDHLVSLTLVERGDGSMRILGKDDFAPVYRDGNLGDALVVHATFELEPDDPARIYERFRASLEQRNATQPVTERSLGCVFRNPEGDSAGRLIERAGCKLLRRGDVQVSGKHANYFVNHGSATAEDFLLLADEVRERVQAEFQAELEFEIDRW